MKFSENWLRTFVNPTLATAQLMDAIAMSGIDVEHVESAGPAFSGVVAGEVTSVRKHPNADRLTVCEVSVGGHGLNIVCGAPNVQVGMKVPTALPGAQLPELTVRKAEVRGVESEGMLCSARELGLSDQSDGLLELPPDTARGADVRRVLELDDQLITLKPTPNRGDCLSVTGIAREVAAVTGAPFTLPDAKPVRVGSADRLSVTLEAPQACPRYCGRLLRGVNARAATPDWMLRRLTGSGIRAISALVDITNYVMLELGQPLHAFDAAKLAGGIRVRFAENREKLDLLNGTVAELDTTDLVIADDNGAIALAGIMGGMESSVSDATRDVFIESAFFSPSTLAGKTRSLGVTSESAYRFERGVDFSGTATALERATQLVLDICGGIPGPVTEARGALPPREPVRLRLARVERLLGVRLDGTQVSDILRRLRFEFTAGGGEFRVTPPSFRFDITLEEDVIEELARIYGYDRIPATLPAARTVMLPVPETRRNVEAIRGLLASRDYQEVINYSFVDESWEQDLAGNTAPVALANPIASHMAMMRSTLAGGLIGCLARNLSHQQARVRLFEIGRCFSMATPGDYRQPVRVGGIAYGDAAPEQWSLESRRVDFFDIKGDVDSLLTPRGAVYRPVEHPALHPGKSAQILLEGRVAGWFGELHPRWQRKYDFPVPPVLFELDYDVISQRGLPAYQEVPRFPVVRRDISAEVDEGVGYEAILAGLEAKRPAIVTEISLFDIYRGSGVGKGRKSLAFRVLLQDTRKTLTESEVESAVQELRQELEQQFNAKLR